MALSTANGGPTPASRRRRARQVRSSGPQGRSTQRDSQRSIPTGPGGIEGTEPCRDQARRNSHVREYASHSTRATKAAASVLKSAKARFEPSGMTNDPDIRAAKSIVDYIFRWMGKKFLTTDQQERSGSCRGSASAASGVVQRAGGQAGGHSGAGGSRPGGPDGAVQCVRGRPGVRQVRRPNGQNGQLLHLQGLRDQTRVVARTVAESPHRKRDRSETFFCRRATMI